MTVEISKPRMNNKTRWSLTAELKVVGTKSCLRALRTRTRTTQTRPNTPPYVTNKDQYDCLIGSSPLRSFQSFVIQFLFFRLSERSKKAVIERPPLSLARPSASSLQDEKGNTYNADGCCARMFVAAARMK